MSALSSETWDLMSVGLQRVWHREPNELTFTDHHLLHLVTAHPGEVRMLLYDSRREARSGADFELWIGDGTTYAALLVQAKRLSRENRYKGLRQRFGKRGLFQLLRLIWAARGIGALSATPGVAYVPTYLFYNGESPTVPAPPPTADGCCGHLAGPSDRGCSIANAEDVRACLGRRPWKPAKTARSTITPVCRPWACLACCPRSGAGTVAERVVLLTGGDETSIVARRDLPADVARAIASPDEASAEARERRGRVRPGARRLLVVTLSPLSPR